MWKRLAHFLAILALSTSLAGAADKLAPRAEDEDRVMPMPWLGVWVFNFPVDDAGNLRVVEQSAAPRQVEVVNLPAVQNVAGTVNVGNLPVVQDVTGSVGVTNLPVDATGALRVAASGPRPFRFVGLTTARFQGNAGRVVMNAACNADYPGSRVAYAEEYVQTPNPPPVTETAWIQARVVGAVSFNDGNGPRFFDSSGTTFAAPSVGSGNYAFSFDCASWTTNGSWHVSATVSPAGAIELSSCTRQPAPVACAAPE